MYFKGVITPQTLTLGETMSNEQIKIGLVVDSNGTTKAEIKDAEKLASTYERASKAATSIGGTSGSRAMAAKAAPVGSQAIIDDKQYNQLRGAAGVTGASARDFAAQAQGLGGLVRAYATFAANIFAVSAAFSALKNAADTTNLVKGLDTLGAASGRSLGSLSKRLVEATDGAISLRDAMTATAQASSAGMTNKNIERLTLVAKNASLALGISMPDALSRLSRGITKLEPELLDELGLFTKIGPATEEYARQIGKSASQLTDFERRQAFANAVLDEGEKKFSALNDAAANPYDKLLSTVKNAGNSILEVINTILKPLVSFLASNPIVVVAGLLTAAGALIKRALPDIFSSYERMQQANERAVETSYKHKAALEQETAAMLKQEAAAKAALKLAADLADRKLDTATITDSAALVKQDKRRAKKLDEVLGQTDYADVTADQLKKLDDLSAAEEGKNKKAQQGYKALATAIREYQAALAAEKAAKENSVQAAENLTRAEQRLAAVKRQILAEQRALQLSSARLAASNILQERGVLGLKAAYATLNQELNKAGLSFKEKLTENVKFGLGALSGGFNKLLGIGTNIQIAISTVVAVWSGLNSVFSKNKDQIEKLDKALETVKDNAKTAQETILQTFDKSGNAINNIQTVNALSTALTELNQSSADAIKRAQEAEKAASGWDKFWDSLFGFFGQGIEGNLSKAMAQSIQKSFKLLQRAGLGDEFETEVKKLLKINNLDDVVSVEAAYRKLSKEGRKALDELRDNATRTLGNTADALQNFKTKTSEATNTYRDFVNSYRDNSPLYKLGDALLQVGTSIAAIDTTDPKRLAEAFDDLTKNPEKAALLGENFVKSFTKISKSFDQTFQSINNTKEGLKQYVAEVQKAEAIIAKTETAGGAYIGGRGQNERRKERQARELVATSPEIIAKTNEQISNNEVIVKAGEALRKAAADAISKGLQLINFSITQAVREGNLGISRAIASNLTGERRAQADTDFARQELQAQIDAINMAKQMATLQTSLVDQTKIANALQQEANALLKVNNLELGKADKDTIDLARKAADEAAKEVIKQRYSSGDTGLTAEQLDTIREAIPGLNIARQQQQGSLNKSFAAPLERLQRQQTANQISGQFAASRGRLEDSGKLFEIEQRINATLLSRASILDGIAGTASEELVLARQKAEADNIEAKNARELAVLQEKVDRDQNALNTAKSRKATSDEEIKRLEGELKLSTEIKTQTEKAQKAESVTTGLKNRQDILNTQLDKLRKGVELETSSRDVIYNKRKNELDLQLEQLQVFSTTYGVDKAITIERETTLQKAKLQLDTEKSIGDAKAAFTAKEEESKARIAALGDDEKGRAAEITAELERQRQLRDDIVSKLNDEKTTRERILDLQKQTVLEQDKYKQKQDQINILAGTIAGLFDGSTGALKLFGDGIGNVIQKMGELDIRNQMNKDALSNNKKAQDEVNSSSQKYIDILDSGGNLTSQQAEEFGKLNAKKISLGKEESALQKKRDKDAYDATVQGLSMTKKLFKEKSAAYKILDATEKAMHIWKMASAIREMVVEKAGTAVSLAESAKKIGAKVVEAGTDGVAAVVKAISAFPPPFNFIAGAATAAAVGMLLSQIGAKSPKAPSGFGAEAAQKVQGTGQAYDADGNIVTRSGGVTGDPTERADSIVSSIEILNTNVFNMLGSKSSTIAKLLSGIKDNTAVFALSLRGRLPGYANMLAPEQVSDTTGTTTGLGLAAGAAAGFKAGGFFGGPFGALVGGALGALVGALFGTKTTRSVEDSGVDIRGTAGGLGRGEGTFENYANIKTTRKSFFGGTKVSYSTQAERMAQDSVDAASRIIRSVNGALVLAGDALEGSGKRVIDLLDQIPIQIKVSAKGLSAKEYAEAVTAEISVQLNNAAEQVFPYLVQYNKIGEEMYETVSRIVSEGENLDYGLSMIGAAITETDNAAKVAKQQDLIEYLGGISKAGESINYYFENFISAEEQYRFNLNRLNTAFTQANLALPKTKKEFTALVDSVKNVDSDAARETLAALLTYSQDFDKLISASNDLRAEELKNLEDSSSKLRDYAKSLRDFSSSLVTGSLSIATPLEKFSQLQSEFSSVAGLAKTGDLEALGKIQNASQNLLTSGRELWASGPKYQELFEYVTTTLADVGTFADAKADVQELQLNAMKNSVSLLENIDTNMAKLAGGEALQTAATGGYRSGLTLVGELGPELVDFQNPGRVYTADQTAGMFAQAPGSGQQFGLMVRELQQLRQEVTILRKDQQKQTGDLIVTNYDATNKLAEQIADAVVQTVADSNWQTRSKPQIK